jgi:hypothetical protein
VIAALVVSVLGQSYCAPVYRQTYQAYRAPTYQAQAYAAPTYQQAYSQPYDQLYLGYPRDPAAYAGYMAQQQRATAAEKAQESLAADVAAIKQYLATAAQPARAEPPPAPGKPDPGPQPVPPPNPAPGDPQFGAPPPPPVPANAGNPKVGSAPQVTTTVLAARCAKCHTAEATDGGSFAIFKAPGVLADLDPLDVDAIERRVRAGTMPPAKAGGRLPADQRAAISQWADELSGPIARALAAARQAPR